MIKMVLIMVLSLSSFAGAVCTPATGGIGLCYPNFNDSGSVWGAAVRNNFVMLLSHELKTPLNGGV